MSKIEFIYDFYLFYINNNNKSHKIKDLQIINIFILSNDIFAIIMEKMLKKAKLLEKNKEKLIFYTFRKFIKGYIRLKNNNSLFFGYERIYLCLYFIIVKKFIDLVSFCDKIRKKISAQN